MTTTTEISWKTTKAESALITHIVKRAVRMQPRLDPATCRMDITATHANGCPLDLEKLLAFDDFNFAHDVFGIYRHIDRDTGRLTDCFVPRCAKP